MGTAAPVTTQARDAMLLAGITSGQSITDTAAQLGISRQTAHVRLNELERDGTVAEALARQGLTVDAIAHTVSRKLDARRRHFITLKPGQVIVERTTEDHAIQLDAAKFAARMLGIDAGERASGTLGIAMSFSPSGCQLAITNTDARVNASVNVPHSTTDVPQLHSNDAVTIEHQPPGSSIVGPLEAGGASTYTGRGKITTRGCVPSSNRSSGRGKRQAKSVPAKRRSSKRRKSMWVD